MLGPDCLHDLQEVHQSRRPPPAALRRFYSCYFVARPPQFPLLFRSPRFTREECMQATQGLQETGREGTSGQHAQYQSMYRRYWEGLFAAEIAADPVSWAVKPLTAEKAARFWQKLIQGHQSCGTQILLTTTTCRTTRYVTTCHACAACQQCSYLTSYPYVVASYYGACWASSLCPSVKRAAHSVLEPPLVRGPGCRRCS